VLLVVATVDHADHVLPVYVAICTVTEVYGFAVVAFRVQVTVACASELRVALRLLGAAGAA
jgi:hypothetical protein